jgi:hypothetical protein
MVSPPRCTVSPSALRLPRELDCATPGVPPEEPHPYTMPRLRLPPLRPELRCGPIPGDASGAIDLDPGCGRPSPVDRPAFAPCHLLYAVAVQDEVGRWRGTVDGRRAWSGSSPPGRTPPEPGSPSPVPPSHTRREVLPHRAFPRIVDHLHSALPGRWQVVPAIG